MSAMTETPHEVVDDTQLTEKRCSLCKKDLPIEQFGKCSVTKDGYQYYCKSCQKIYRRGRKNLKQCASCRQYKPRYEYYQSRLTEDGLFDVCKSCCKTYSSNSPGRKHYEKYFSSTALSR